MIEVPQLPSVGVVAFATVLAQTSIVGVVFRMTPETILWRIIEPLSGMTLPARNDHVKSQKRIPRLIVIESHLLPLRRGMALLAFFAQRAAMRFIRAMTVDTLGAQLPVVRDPCVTDMTVEARVRALERELEAREVIETAHAPRVVAVTFGTGWS